VRYGAGVVPVVDEAPGRLIPALRWEEDGPLRSEAEVRRWYAAHPYRGLAITLDNPKRKLLLVDDDCGKHPAPEDRPRPRALAGYRERTRSGGFHNLAEIKVAPPPTVPRRVINLGKGFVDLMLEGIVYVAPTVNVGVGEYSVLDDRDPPTYESVLLALQDAEPSDHPWLVDAWRAARLSPTGTEAFRRTDQPVPKDAEELLARMASSSPAGAVAAWIARNTEGSERPWDLCYHVGHHAWASGGSPDQVRAVVRCPNEEWGDGYETLSRRFGRRAPAGLTTLRRFPEGQAAYEILQQSAPKEVASLAYRPARHDLLTLARRSGHRRVA
jgi:hypothetical protein